MFSVTNIAEGAEDGLNPVAFQTWEADGVAKQEEYNGALEFDAE